MTKRRMKKSVKIIAFVVIMVVILSIIFMCYFKHINSLDYKLTEIGYNEEEILFLKVKLDESKMDDILNMEYDQNIVPLLKEKYFIYNNFNKYLDYKKNNTSLSVRDVVEIINTNRERDYYTDVLNSNLEKDSSLLVNKYYKLSNDYVPEDLVNVSLSYAYSGVELRRDAYDAYRELFNAAKADGHVIVISSGYRSYSTQENIYNKNKTNKGIEYAEAYVARAGHSEHQTGLAVDVADFNNSKLDFKDTDSYNWMLENAYKYGFILRYPENKENITGYNFEAWHYRYVGKSIAKDIQNLGITYDEYYTYYIENK